eukprot:g1703.t1
MQNAVFHSHVISRPFTVLRVSSPASFYQNSVLRIISSNSNRLNPISIRNRDPCLTSGSDQGERVTIQSSSKDVHETSPSQDRVMERIKLFISFLASAGVLYLIARSPLAFKLRGSVMSSWLGKSGFVASLSLIFLSEIGDKTFFICAILAMRLGRWISLIGTTAALATMTVLSVGIGVAFNAVPDAMKTSIPLGKYLSVALLFFFGIRSLLNGGGQSSEEQDELLDAEETVEQAAQSGQVGDEQEGEQGLDLKGRLRSVFMVSALIFVAEWGDRSMLTTIALGASQNPFGVALGGIVGHFLAAIIAVLGGSLISNFISEKSVSLISGVLFVIFAITTSLNWT